MNSDKMMKGSNWTSLMLMGDVRGLSYVGQTIREAPDRTFNFCCTIDGRAQKEANLSGAMRPQKMNNQYVEEPRQIPS